MKFKLTALVLALSLITSCSTTPTQGDVMMSTAKESKILGTQWNAGNKLVSSGQAMTKKGESLVSLGKQQVSEGEDNLSSGYKLIKKGSKQIAEGRQLKLKSEQTYKQHFSNTSSS